MSRATDGGSPETLAGTDHFITALRTAVTSDDDRSTCTAPVTSFVVHPLTGRVRIGVLSTMIDLIAGMADGQLLTPTLDLRTRIFLAAPTVGTVTAESRPLKLGRTMYTAATELFADDGTEGVSRHFATATTTFLNHPYDPATTQPADPTAPRLGPASHVDDAIVWRVVNDHSIDVFPDHRILNGARGTIQGGAQCIIAEIAIEQALAGSSQGSVEVIDLDTHYLSPFRIGPLRATVTVLGPPLGPIADTTCAVEVALTDTGRADALVSVMSGVAQRS